MIGLRLNRARRFAHRVTVVSVYGRKGERGTGVAAHLLNEAMIHAYRLGVRQLELSVNAENTAATRFYQRHGFVEVGRIPNGFGVSGGEIDGLIMALR